MLDVLTAHKKVPTEQGISPAQDTFGHFTWESPSGLKSKSALILPVKPNDWTGITAEDAKGAFIFIVRVHTLDEGTRILQALAPQLGLSIQIEERPTSGADFRNYTAEGILTDRGYQELVFRSNQKIVLNNVSVASDGQRHFCGVFKNNGDLSVTGTQG